MCAQGTQGHVLPQLLGGGDGKTQGQGGNAWDIGPFRGQVVQEEPHALAQRRRKLQLGVVPGLPDPCGSRGVLRHETDVDPWGDGLLRTAAAAGAAARVMGGRCVVA
eukprot:evm.model.NODE_41154_length_22195_cov_27.575174.4